MGNEQPIVLAYAGPNGSGKSTITQRMPSVGVYVNADIIKAENHLSDLEAAQAAESLRNELLNKRVNFSFETVLSTDRNLLLLEKAKALDYEVHCIYVLTCDENINVARVKARVAMGGHDVPEEKIRSRYHRALDLVPRLVQVCDRIIIYDNSVEPCLLFERNDDYIRYYANRFWTEEQIRKLVQLK